MRAATNSFSPVLIFDSARVHFSMMLIEEKGDRTNNHNY